MCLACSAALRLINGCVCKLCASAGASVLQAGAKARQACRQLCLPPLPLSSRTARSRAAPRAPALPAGRRPPRRRRRRCCRAHYLAPLPSTVLRAPPPPAGLRAAPPAHADGMPSAFSAFRRAAPHAAPQVHEQHMMLLCRLALAHFLSCHMSHCFLASRTRRSCEPTIGLPAHSCLSSPRLPVSMSQWQYCSSPPAWPIPGARATGRLRRAS